MADEKEIHMTGEALEEMVGHPLRRSNDIKSIGDITVSVGRLEQSIESTNSALRDFANRTTNDVDRLTKSIEELTRNQLLGKQTNWGMIASWVGVMILLLGLVVYQPLQELRVGINNHKSDGHPSSVIARVENNENRFNDIATRIQREVELLEAADKARHQENTSRIKGVEDWVLEHQSVSPKEHAVLSERIANNKERLDRETPMIREHDIQINSLEERILDIEREIYTDAAYRSGRPIKPPIAVIEKK